MLENLVPQRVFYYFEEICKIPHGSKNTWQISNYLKRFAEDRGLFCIQDELGNIIIKKPGTAGYENSEPVIIQGHMDMVCEKEADRDIDFANDGLELRYNDEYVWANGTTLGGDDGIAVAFALAILESKYSEIEHPPLEVVITVDEEIGMYGAAYIDCSRLDGKRMLNLDSEEEGVFLVSCAGGGTVTGRLDVNYVPASGEGSLYQLVISGGVGGHSGVEIDKQRANCNKLIGRFLNMLLKLEGIALVEVNGGLKDNAIPREASAVVLVPEAVNKEFCSMVAEFDETLKKEYLKTDPELGLTCKRVDEPAGSVMDAVSTNRIASALVLAPNGILKMSNDIDGLVQTSVNVGILKTVEAERYVNIGFCVRSSVLSERDALIEQVKCLFEALGGMAVSDGVYPAWEYKNDSPLRELMLEEFERMYGRKPQIQALHAGVECGLFAGDIPGLDCVSYGPDIFDIHTPKERLSIESVKRTYEYTLEILKKLK